MEQDDDIDGSEDEEDVEGESGGDEDDADCVVQ